MNKYKYLYRKGNLKVSQSGTYVIAQTYFGFSFQRARGVGCRQTVRRQVNTEV